MKLCLFGGSFDPVHCGHLRMAEAAAERCALDEVLFLPAAESPFKIGQRLMFSPEQRLSLLQLATERLPWARVSDWDLQLPPPSWSWRLVEKARQEYPTAELCWLMGTDQWQALHRWRRYEDLCRELHFIVFHRGAAPQPREGVRSTFIAGHHPASSTAIRRCLQDGTPLPPDYLPPAVEVQARAYLGS